MNATATRKNRTYLEAGLIVEMHDGSERHLTIGPYNGSVYHMPAGECFGEVTITDENTFRRQVRRVVSRSKYDNR